MRGPEQPDRPHPRKPEPPAGRPAARYKRATPRGAAPRSLRTLSCARDVAIQAATLVGAFFLFLSGPARNLPGMPPQQAAKPQNLAVSACSQHAHYISPHRRLRYADVTHARDPRGRNAKKGTPEGRDVATNQSMYTMRPRAVKAMRGHSTHSTTQHVHSSACRASGCTL